MNIEEQFYTYWKGYHDKQCYLVSYPEWDKLSDEDKKFWVDFVNFANSKYSISE